MPGISRAARLLPLLAATLVAACGSAAAGATPAPHHWTGAVLSPPQPKPEFTLTDQSGHPFDFQRGTAGKVTLLYFGYTHCPDVCPADMAMLAFAVRDLPASLRSRVAVVFVTTDPSRDTPPVLAAWLRNFDPSFIGLTGDRAHLELAQVRSAVSLASPEAAQPSGTYYVDHAAQIIAYTPDDAAHLLFFEGMPAAAVASDLQQLAAHGWTG